MALRSRSAFAVAMTIGVFATSLVTASTASAGTSIGPHLDAPGVLTRGVHYLYSGSSQYRLLMQDDGNLVEQGNGKVVFNTRTEGHPGATAEMQSDGNFVVYDVNRAPLFNTRTNGNPGAYLDLQDDGNIVIDSAAGRPLWASFSVVDTLGKGIGTYGFPQVSSNTDQSGVHPEFLSSRSYGTIALVSGTQLFVGGAHSGATFATPGGTVSATGHTELLMQDDGDLVLWVDLRTNSPQRAWSSRTQGNPGSRAVVQDDGNFVVYAPSGRPLWSSKYGRTY